MPVTYGDIVRADLMSIDRSNRSRACEHVCPECLETTSSEELEMFGGLCEECSGAFDE